MKTNIKTKNETLGRVKMLAASHHAWRHLRKLAAERNQKLYQVLNDIILKEKI